jgi:hypothetical protein
MKPFNFGVYICYRENRLFPRLEKVVVLAVDMQAALSTVPRAIRVERVDSEREHIVINKAVLKMFKEKAGKRNRKEARA